ncbi:MAG: DUF349 domain-containing protein [Sphingobacteriales bacterium]|nr:MAG: DUF349 domain-containing protein [Sphingobacteriales bacterium]
MEEVKTQEDSQVSPLQAWWSGTQFSGKELYELKDNGELYLKPIGKGKERTIGTFTPENADFVLKALMDKFHEVEAKVRELQTEWSNTTDKLKILGKVERTKEYLHHSNAVGNYQTLLQEVDGMEQELHKLTDENYQARLKLVQQAEGLVDSDNWKETTQIMRDLPEQWKHIGYTDKHRSDELWNRLEAARNKFFDRKRQNQEDINKEMLQNLDLKMELVEKAEKLASSESWKETTEIFRQLIEDWKKIGRTLPEKNEELWHRFITAKNVFYDRKKGHFDSIQQEQEQNYAAKIALVERAESMKDSTDWNKTAQAFGELMEEWKAVGRVPLEKADEIWNRLNAAREQFFQAKRRHFETVRVELDDNYAQKLALLKRAEALQQSNRWREATDEMNELMTEWKKIGPVPREHSNTIWEQFIAARKGFFERKDANREQRKSMLEKRREQRVHQARSFYKQIEDELKEEQDRLADFKNGLENITPGHKEHELRQHLQKLIAQTEDKIQRKQAKLDSVKQEVAEIERQENIKEPSAEMQESPQPEGEA